MNPYEPHVSEAKLSSINARRPHAARLRTLAALVIVSLGVMLPWPVTVIGAVYRIFDHPSEALFPFCGLTALVLAEFVPAVSLSDTAFFSVGLVVWCLVLVLPPTAMVRWRLSCAAIVALLLLQSAFSFLQALIGSQIILGKGC